MVPGDEAGAPPLLPAAPYSPLKGETWEADRYITEVPVAQSACSEA